MTSHDRSDGQSDDSISTNRSPVAGDRRRVLAGAGGALGALAFGTGVGVRPALAGGDDEHDEDEGEDDEHGEDDGKGDDETMPGPFASVEFSNQYSDGATVVVDSIVLSDGGYVAIHDARLLEGALTDSVIGVSAYLPPGAHYDLEVPLFDVPGGDFDREALDENALLIPMPHKETDDDEEYDFVTSGGEDDGPYTEDGLPTVDAGFVVIDESSSDDCDTFALVDFRNQSEVDDEVVVREVTLSDGGFVALHDARLLVGKPFESVVGVSEYLPAGQHQSVPVAVEDADDIAEVDLPARPLIPMPHRDTNDDEEYDFVDSEGEHDGPYTKAGQAVIDVGLVTVED